MEQIDGFFNGVGARAGRGIKNHPTFHAFFLLLALWRAFQQLQIRPFHAVGASPPQHLLVGGDDGGGGQRTAGLCPHQSVQGWPSGEQQFGKRCGGDSPAEDDDAAATDPWEFIKDFAHSLLEGEHITPGSFSFAVLLAAFPPGLRDGVGARLHPGWVNNGGVNAIIGQGFQDIQGAASDEEFIPAPDDFAFPPGGQVNGAFQRGGDFVIGNGEGRCGGGGAN